MLRRLQSKTILTIAVLLLVGFNTGYFLPRFPSQSLNLFNLVPGAFALATPANYLSFQGQLTDQNGAPITTMKTLTLSIYDALSGGNLIYNETQSVTPDSRGIFYVQIGFAAGNGVPAGSQSWPLMFDLPYWLAVRVGVTGAYLSPRISITSSPYPLTRSSVPARSFTTGANPPCTDTTNGAAKNMGFGVTYTTSASTTGTIYIGLTFDLKSPAVAASDTSTWQLVWGTGSAPACNAAPSGTARGNSYIVQPGATVFLEMAQSVGVTITGLSPSTAHWFDVQATDNSVNGWIYSKPVLSVTDIVSSTNPSAATSFVSNANTCNDVTTVARMMGFGLTYTTGRSDQYSGDIYVTLTFQTDWPTNSIDTTKWQVAWGTSGAPACNAGATGTPVGKQYTIADQTTNHLMEPQNTGFVLTGLTASTTYWFDVQATDSATNTWTYSKPQMAVIEEPILPGVPSNLYFTSDANSCGTASAAGVMGLGPASGSVGVYYQTSSSSSGNIYGTFTFNLATAATSGQLATWQLAFGIGATPICAAAATGTLVGNSYSFNSEAAVVGGNAETVSFVLTGLLKDTIYWFDVKMIASSGTVTASNPQLSVSEATLGDIPHSNVHFMSTTASCADSTASAVMGGLSSSATNGVLPMTYTVRSWGTGNIQVTLNFKITTPAVASGDTTQWQFNYGTGATPACSAGVTGTTVGNLYEQISNTATPRQYSESLSVVITGLTQGTTYWFDVRVTDGNTNTWTYANPQISVVEVA